LQAFKEKVVEECATDTDFIWIHDYHLLVLPSLLRKRFNKVSHLGDWWHL
jgi:trehalose 6-phosphate synthase/phosphatase